MQNPTFSNGAGAGAPANHTTNTATEAQRARLLTALIEAQADGVTTIEARSELNIMQPAARIQELRDRGYSILSPRISAYDDQGRRHQGIARYVLQTMPKDGGATV